MSHPRVSILTITYNQSDYIGPCIESVLSQTFSDWEMVIVDDGSEDDTFEKARSFSDKRILPLRVPHGGIERLKENYGLALGHSSGPLLAILDGDDWWPADKLEAEVPAFDDPSVAMAFGSADLYNESNEFIGSARVPEFAAGLRSGKAIIDRILNTGYFPFSVTTMVRRSAIEALGGFIQPTGLPLVDVPTWLHVLCGARSFGFQQILGCYRIHQKSVCQSRSAEIARGQMCYNEHFLEANWEKMGLSVESLPRYNRGLRAYHHHRRGMLDLMENNGRSSLKYFLEAFNEGGLLRKVKAGFRISHLAFRLLKRKEST